MASLHANSAREALVEMCTLPLLAGAIQGEGRAIPRLASSPLQRPASVRDRHSRKDALMVAARQRAPEANPGYRGVGAAGRSLRGTEAAMNPLLLLFGIPLLLCVGWAVWYDVRQRRRGGAEPHDVRAAARNLRIESEGKAGERGAGL